MVELDYEIQLLKDS